MHSWRVPCWAFLMVFMVFLPGLAIASSTVGPGDVALSATATASSQNTSTGQLASKAIDGVIDGYPGDYTKEWATVGQLAGAWIRLTWTSPVTLGQIILHDRPNLTDNVLSGTLQFSDGSTIDVGQLPNDGTGLPINFLSRTVTWVQFTVTNAVGYNIGLAEFEAYSYGSLTSLTLSPNPVSGGSTSQGTVQAAGPAPSGGTVISLSSSNTSVATVPTYVTIPAGATSAAFTVTTYAVTGSASSTITATTSAGSSVSSTLTVTSQQDIARTATVSVSSQNVSTSQLGIKAIDGVIDGYPGDYTKEWATVGELGLYPGSSAYAWIRLDWSYVTISEVDLYDRPNLTDNITSGTLKFSDGSSIAVGPLPNNGSVYPVTFPPKNVSWVEFDIDSAAGYNTGLSEIEVMGGCAVTPSVRIAAPHSEYLQTSTASLTVTAQTCLDPVNNAGWGVRFLLDGGPGAGGAQLDTYTAPYQVTFTNLAKGEHTIDAYLIDASGNVASGADTHDRVNHIGIGDYYVTMGDSISEGIGDDYSADDYSTDGRNGPVLAILNCGCGGGGYEPILNNLLTSQRGIPQTVVNEAVGGSISSNGVNIINTVLARHPGAEMFLVQYGTNDSSYMGTGVPSGLNLNPGDPGYAGSFKDNLQQIINAVNAAGKKIALAKAPMALADCGNCAPYSDPSTAPKNLMIQQYNQVVDQLVADPANNITVVPPDFYTFFSNNLQDYSDELHPNGVGYQAMANLWDEALTGGSGVAALSSLVVQPTTALAGSKPEGTVILSAAAPSGGAVVTLSSSNAGAATVPASVTVPAGTNSATFPVNTLSVGSAFPVTITASYGGVSKSATITVEPLTADVALSATATASSQNTSTGQLASKAIDGIVDGYPGDYTKEWATVGQLTGAWIRLTWNSPVTLGQIILHDRPNLDDHVLSGTLQFSDGSSINVGQLPNDGTGLAINFTSRTVSWVQFNVTNAVGYNIGLAEFEAYGQ